MLLRGHTSGWTLFFLACLIPGVHLQKNDSSVQLTSDPEQPSEVQIYRPVLQPSEAVPPLGTYMLRNPLGKPCIKVTTGVEYVVITEKTWYFNLDPSRTRVSGYCNSQNAVLSLTLPNNTASLQFFFLKEKKQVYVTKMTAHLSTLPTCKGCPNKTYFGLVDHEKMFATDDRKSFKCKSKNLILMSSQLQIKLVPLKMQAFTLPKGQYGEEVKCWADYNRRVIPIIIGAVVVTIVLIAALSWLFIKDRRRQQGYERL